MPTLDHLRPGLLDAVIVPATLRHKVTALALVAAFAVAVLGVVHRSASRPDAFDRPVTAALRSRWPQPGSLSYTVDALVTAVPILVTVGLVVAACLLTRQRRLAVLALLGPLCVAVATTVLKPLVGRTIHGDNLSFPSGHTGYATAVGLVLGLLLLGLVRPARTAGALLLLVTPAVVTGGLMSLDQLVLDAHYPSDAVGGFCTATAVVLALAVAADRLVEVGTSRLNGRT